MNFIPAIGPFDIKVFGSQKGYVGKPIEFIIRNENVIIQEILILNPKGDSSSCDILDKQLEGHLSLEFSPDTVGTHEIRIFSSKKNRDSYNSFNFFIYDSSKISIKLNGSAVVAKNYSFNVICTDLPDGNLLAHVEQEDRKIRPIVKSIKKDENLSIFEVNFVPEAESMCKIDLEYVDKSDNILNGSIFRINAKALDFLVIPFPLMPFQINKKCSFNIKILRKFVRNLKVCIKSANDSNDVQECELVLIEKDFYEVFFVPKNIERHFVEIFFGNSLINQDRLIKIDTFDVSKITAKMPDKINFGELNTFIVDTSGAGEGNLEVIIKDGFDTLKAQLLKREKRKFEIGFLSERNTKHDIQIVFNGVPIKDSPFVVLPEYAIAKTQDLCEMSDDEISAIEGGPIESIQCSEKMWLIYDIHSTQYSDVQFFITDDSNLPIKHTKIQLDDGRWRVEFIPINTGLHKIQRIIKTNNASKIQTLSKLNVLHFSTQRAVYGYKLYSKDESVQLVFDAADLKVNDICIQIKDPSEKLLERYECKYLSDYLAIKFRPRLTGAYFINFFDRTSHKMIAASPYKLIVHEPFKEIMRSSGVYDLTRLIILGKNFDKEFSLNQFTVIVYDSNHSTVKNCKFFNKFKDLVIEFVTRTEGMHKIYLYINDDLVDDNPFYIYVNGESQVSNSLSTVFSPFTKFKSSLNNVSTINSQSSNELNASNSNSRSQIDSTSTTNSLSTQPNISNGSIMCAKKNAPFHFVIHNKNLQGLCVYDPLNEPVSFKLTEDEHENGSVTITPKLDGTHKIIGLIEGRDFEAHIFVLDKPEYESLFEMNNYNSENIVEKPYIITLKEPNLEVDVYDPLGERVDVRYSADNLATFVPRTTGYFKIYISDYHGPVLGSPFYALIHSNKNRNCIESSGIRDTILNEEATFIIRNKELEIDVLIKDPYGKKILLRKRRFKQGFLQIWYTPQIIGPHEILITRNGVKIQSEPIVIFVSDPNKVKIENLKKSSTVNKNFSFNIDATQAGEGFIRVNIKDPKFNDILPEINELDDRKYLVSFVPEIQGTYEFSLTFNKYHLTESPFKINITESSDTLEAKLPNCQSPEGNCLITDEQLNDTNIEYELTNWNQQINNSLNKIMEIANQSQNKRSLSPITDTSEEESDSLVYKGETYIENVERLPDGTSQLMLRIDENPDLIDASNPNKARGRYKYRLKRIPLPENWTHQKISESAETNQLNESPIDLTDNFAEDFDPELMALAEKQDMARTGPGGYMRRISNLEDIKEETETYSTSSQKSASAPKRKESSKSKHFKVDNNDRSFDSCETLGDVVRSMTLSETESEGEINVGNESSVTKVTREKQKKINLEKTVIIEENYVIEPKSEMVSKIPKRIGSDKSSTSSKSESSKSSVDNELKITTNESGKNKPKTKEKITVKQKLEPCESKLLGDEKSSEKFKPIESIQYDYEHVIEDRSQHNTPEPDNKKNIKIENVKLKKIESETKENFKTSKDSGPDSVRTTTTHKTVLITETQEDKIVETIENEKSTQEFSYSQKRNRDGKLSNLKNNLAQLAERLNPILVQQDEPLHSASIKKKPFDESKFYVLSTDTSSDKDLSSAPPSFNSYENIVEYYKLQPNQFKDEKNELKNGNILLEAVDLNQFQTGEQFKPDESVSINDLASFSKGMTTKVSEEPKIKDGDEDSLAEIEENFVITFKSPSENEPLVESELKPVPVKSGLSDQKSNQKQLETISDEDYFKPEAKSLDLIKAKFENNNESQCDTNRSKSSEGVGKLPKSKFEIYNKESKKFDSDSLSSRKPNLTQLESPKKKSEQIVRNLDKKEESINQEISTDSFDKGIKGLMNKYERNSSRESTSREMTSDSLEPKPIRKLSQNIVQLFDRKDSDDSVGNRSRSSYRSSGSENRFSKSSHSSPRSQIMDNKNDDVDDVFLEKNQDEEIDSSSSRVRKLSKIFNEKSRETSQSDSPRSSLGSERKSRFETKIPKPETKSKEKKLSDSFRKFEEESKRLYENNQDNEPVVNDSGVKDLVSKYEISDSKSPSLKKIVNTLIDDSKPDPGIASSQTSSISTKKFSSSSDRTLSPSSPTTKENKLEEKNIKKLISKYEIPKMLENLIEPNEIYSVDDNYQTFDIDLPKKQSREHSIDHLFESEEKGVKRLVDIYDRKPSTCSKHSISSDSLNTKSVPTHTDNSEKKSISNFLQSNFKKEIQKEFFDDDKLKQVETANSIYENNLANLTAVVHIPGQTRGVKKGPKIRALLRIDTDEELKFNVTTSSGHRVPFRVKRKEKMSFLMFSYHRVVDFNVGILNKSEAKRSPQKYRAQLEIKITDEYDFKIVKRDNLELIPIEVKRNLENIYEISFEPSATSSYILQASKNDAEKNDVKENLPEKTLQDYENLINKAKNEIYKKLNDINQPTNVLLQIEHTNPIMFFITDSLTNESIEFKPSYKPRNRHLAYFEYNSLTDFSIEVQKNRFREELNYRFNKQNDDALNASIEVTSSNEHQVEIFRKDNQEMLKLEIQPKINDSYKILFNPKPFVVYTLRIVPYSNNNNEVNTIKSKLNQVIDNLSNDIFIPDSGSDVKLNFSVNKKEKTSEYNLNDCDLTCSLFNPKNLDVQKLESSTDFATFLVKNRKFESGNLKSYATNSDNIHAYVEQEQLDRWTYSVKVYGNSKTGPFKLYLDYL